MTEKKEELCSTREQEIREALVAPFSESEIEWRIQSCGTKNGNVWARCLAYVSARAIMDRLDQVVGISGWCVSYAFHGTNGVMASLALCVGGKAVIKQDGAEMTEIESFKGGISSALKRAAVLFGIGRYLYRLESGFVKIVDSGTPGAYWGRVKDGPEFYWLPPKLPDWALPQQTERYDLLEKVKKEFVDHGLNGSTEAEKKVRANVLEHVFKRSSWSTVENLPLHELKSCLEKLPGALARFAPQKVDPNWDK